MTLTVYSMGDLPIFTGVLNATAMAFNSSLFNPAEGAGVVMVGLLMTCVWMILSALNQGKIDHKPLIFVILLFYAGVMPKERVQVEDIFTGQIAVVDNVPLVVALPASIIASLNRALTDKIETAFSTTDGSYLAMGAEGFASPLKLLMGLRNLRDVFPVQNQNIEEFIRYCALTEPLYSETFSVQKLKKSPDVVGYLAGLNVSGVMTYHDPLESPSAGGALGIGISCSLGKERIKNDLSPAAIQAALEAAVKTNTAGEIPAGSGLGASVAGVEQAYNSVTAGIMGNLQDAQQFMLNVVTADAVNGALNCFNQPAGSDNQACHVAVMSAQAIEQGNVDAAAQASIFTKTMIPGMNILMALFFAFSPIIIAVAFLAGPHGIKIATSFLMFGIWTQSWMPVAAVINYLIEMQTQNAFSSWPATGVTLQNYMQFYNVLSIKLGMASTLMASVPLLTFALLSGSAMAVTKVASNLGAKDYVDEKIAAPSLASQSAAVNNGALLDQGTRAHLHSAGGNIHSDMVRNAGFNPFSKLDLADTQRKSAEQAQSHFKTAQTGLDSALSSTWRSGMTEQQSADWLKQTQSALTATDGTAAKEVKRLVATNKEAQSMGHDDREKLEVALGLKVAGLGASSDKVISTMKNKQVAMDIMKSKDFSDEIQRSQATNSSRGFAKNLRTNAASIMSDDKTNQISQAVGNSERAETKLARTESRSRDVGVKNEQDIQTLGTLLASKFGTGTDDLINGQVAPSDQQAYAAEERRLLSSVPEHLLQNRGVRAAAKLQALAAVNQDAFLELLQQNQLAGMQASGEPQGANVAALNRPIEDKAGALDTERTTGVEAATAPATNLKGSKGVSIKAVEQAIATANEHIEKNLKDKDHLGAGGQMGRDRIAAEQEATAEFMRKVEQNGWVNEHGDIAGFANLADAGRQYANFEEAHPGAAAAVAMTPMGRAFKAGKSLAAAEDAVMAAKSSLEAAQGAKNIATAEQALAKATAQADKLRETFHEASALQGAEVAGAAAATKSGA